MKSKKTFLILIIFLLSGCTTEPLALVTTTPTLPIQPSNSYTATNTTMPTTSPTATSPPTPDFTPTPEGAIRFAVIGDYGKAGPHLRAVSELVKNWAPDFILTLGDNNYPDGRADTIDENIGQYFHDYIGNYQGSYGAGSETNRFFPTLGNHDWSASNAEPYLNYFTLPGNERYYDFLAGSVHFFAIDSDSREPDGIGRSTIQAQWLRETQATSTAPWQIVFMHHAPYSSGDDHGDYPPVQWPFAKWGTDIVLTGHEHLYERLNIGGIPYIINGLGGSSARYGFGPTRKGSIVRFRDTHGALFVEADASQIKIQFITIEGEIIDSLTLTH